MPYDIVDRDLIDSLLPLPHELRVSGSRLLEPSRIGVALGEGVDPSEPRIATALRLLAEAGVARRATGGEALRIELGRTGGSGELERRLASLPNAEQAYAIVPDTEVSSRLRSLTLLGNGPLGILYAARTLVQILRRSGSAVAVPCAAVVDWPDIGERGQWGGNARDEIEWTSRFKLNVVEESVGLSVDEGGRTRLELGQEHIDRAHSLGVAIVPYILHLEQVALYAGLMGRSDITSTPDPSRPLPPEYVPGLCMSSPATVRLVGDWMELIAGYEHISAIEVWLSEDRSACHCERCSGREPFELEVRCIQEAFERARARKPHLRLRILLTQGSYPVNDKVIASCAPDVQVTYYDGGRTYDSSHAPMIYPLLEEEARRGRWLGVYPQITHCWRTVFPFTAPQLIRARAREFADKGLANVIGYAVPSNRHHEFNVVALAEWSWNARGRSPEELARAWARMQGLRSPERYAKWAVEAGEAGWWLAESRMLLRLIYNEDVALAAGGAGTEDHRFRNAGLQYDRATIEGALARADAARKLAPATGLRAAVEESEAVYAGLAALLSLDTLASGDARPRSDAELGAALDWLDRAAGVLSRNVSTWGARVNATVSSVSPASGALWVRLRDTSNVLFRAADALRGKAAFRVLPDPYARYRQVRLGSWEASYFGEDRVARFSFDVTELGALEGGRCFACFSYREGEYAAEIRSVGLRLRSADGSERGWSASRECPMRVGRWEKWHEIEASLPAIARPRGTRVFMEIELCVVILPGARREGWQCRGEIGFRPGWPESIGMEG